MQEWLDVEIVSGGIIFVQDIDEGAAAKAVRDASPRGIAHGDDEDVLAALAEYGIACEGMNGKGITFATRIPNTHERGMFEASYRRLMGVMTALAPYVEAGSSLTFETGYDSEREDELARPWQKRETFLFTGGSVLWITAGGDIKPDLDAD